MIKGKICIIVLVLIFVVGNSGSNIYAATNDIAIRVLLDNAYSLSYGDEVSEARNRVATAEYQFNFVWEIQFSPSITHVSPLYIDNCSLPIASNCTDSSCGSGCNNGSTLFTNGIHHKNGYQNFYKVKRDVSAAGYDLMLTLTSAALCNSVLGLGDITGKHSLVTNMTNFSSYLKTRIIQHEISHNFNCSDGGCTARCIMSGGWDSYSPWTNTNIWCLYHQGQFNRSLH